jgi:hypothetical protein
MPEHEHPSERSNWDAARTHLHRLRLCVAGLATDELGKLSRRLKAKLDRSGRQL